ncbi:flavodoxin domain-containing protein [Clostridium thermarum]|uniref:flavodoxin domain-containing protein n=1 Tax=Clostridium thermarum TaxID=1716543 RepID=UPI0013D6343F|nr:flavodoxin domain-containing protein [Clostridium thermarum]
MKSLIIYFSNYKNNTERIAKVFAEKINADLINLKGSGEIKIEDYNLIGFGSGVYKEDLAPQIYKYVDKLNLKDKKVFVFSTSGVGFTYYNNKLIRLLEAKGASCKGSFACKGSFVSREFSDKKIFEFMSKFAEGHPNEKDFRKAEKFIDKVVQ